MSKLMNCEVCEKPHAKSAVACPHCGAKNQYIHPFFRAAQEKAAEISPEISFHFASGEELHGQNTDYGFGVVISSLGAVACFLACPLFLFGIWWTSLLLIVGVGMTIVGGILMTLKAFIGSPLKTFKVVVSENGIHWASNDDGYFSEWKAHFERESKRYFDKAS